MSVTRKLLAITFCIVMTGCAGRSPAPRPATIPNDAAVDSIQATAMWEAPTYGTPVWFYECEFAHGQCDTTMRLKKRFTVPDSTRTRLRVRGVDTQWRVGPYSEWSNWYPVRPSGGDTINIHDPVRPGRE